MARVRIYKDGDKWIYGQTRNIVAFWELSPEWQEEAKRNSDDYEDISYLGPLKSHKPNRHILWDLSECMRVNDPHMDGVIGISNNSALAVKLSDCGEIATIWNI